MYDDKYKSMLINIKEKGRIFAYVSEETKVFIFKAFNLKALEIKFLFPNV